MLKSLCVCFSAAGGEIFDHCVSDELLPEAQITRLIRQTLEGVQHLHSSNLVHLDLKVSAWFFSLEAPGLARLMRSGQPRPMGSFPSS